MKTFPNIFRINDKIFSYTKYFHIQIYIFMYKFVFKFFFLYTYFIFS